MKKWGQYKTKNYRPLRVLILLLFVHFFLALIIAIVPSGELSITDNLTYQFPSFHNVFYPDTSVQVSIKDVLADVKIDDTSKIKRTQKKYFSVTPLDSSKRITYSATDSLHPLQNFFIALKKIQEQDHTIHILHYGDSQLEGDRISSYLRKKMQLRFGGSGVGIVLPIDISNARRTILQHESKDWRKWAIYGKRNKQKNGLYGIGGSTYSFTGKYKIVVGYDTLIVKHIDNIESDTLKKDSSLIENKIAKIEDSTKSVHDTIITPIFETKTMQSSWLTFKVNPKTDSLNKIIKSSSLLYHAEDTSFLTYSINGKNYKKTLYPTTFSKKIFLSSKMSLKKLGLYFNGASPFVDAVILDGDKGIAVDNFPMRGSSGLGYTTINSTHLKTMFTQVNAKLIIMQYGINVVPHPRKNYDYYYRMFKAQLVALKKAKPNMSILIIGPSDMSRRRKGKYESYPNIPIISSAMKRAAFETNCAFWNLYKAMGGQNSMISWVNNKPSLASKDYTHFNPRGAEFVGQMIYNALMYDYENWLNLTQ